MLVVTTNDVPGARVRQTLGQCFGVVVRSRGIGGNLMAGLRSIVGGEIHEYTAMLEEARRHALDRLVANASMMGANAVVAMRFDSSEIGETMSEIVAYGTAVVLVDAASEAQAGAASSTASSASAASAESSFLPPTFGHRPMLRNLVLALAALLTLGGLVMTVLAGPAGLSTLGFGLVLLVGTLFERVRYKRLAPAAPDARFRPTTERFRDDATRAPVTVYVDPATGERAYVKE